MIPLSTKFLKNTLIETFEELGLFTSVKMMYDGTTSYGNSFSGCTKLTKTNTDNITYFRGGTNESAKPFYGTAVENVYLPNVTQLNQYAFQSGPSYATSGQSKFHDPGIYVLGASLTTLSNANIFSYSYRKKFFIYAKTPPTGSTLNNTGSWYREIYVPDESWDSYQEAAAWANVKSQIKKLSEYTGEKPWEELYPEELGLV